MLQPLPHIYLCIEVSRLRSPHALSHSKTNQLWRMDLTSSATWRHRRWIERNFNKGRIWSTVRQDEWGMSLFIGHLLIPDHCVRYWQHSLCLQEAQEWAVCCCYRVSAQSCPTLCNPMDYSPPGSSVHRIFQARILEWVAIFYSRGSSWPRDWTHISCVSCIGKQILYHCDTWEAPINGLQEY